MSSKKQRRRKQREEEAKKGGGGGMNPATRFIILIAVILGFLVGGALLFGESNAPGDPPWPGAVWSEQHGHWH